MAGGSLEDDDFVGAGAAGEALGVVAAGAFAEDFGLRSDEGVQLVGDMAIY